MSERNGETVAVLEAQGIGLAFNGIPALKDVSTKFIPGKVHALVGENGAGKSSLAKVVSGIYRPTKGEVRLLGRAVQFSNPLKARLSGVALIHQEPTPFPDLTLAENIFVGAHPTRYRLLERKQMFRRAEEIFSLIGIQRSPHELAASLPIADQQLLELAAAMVQDLKVVIFDETTAPLTPNEVDRLFQIIQTLKRQGVAVGIVSHHLHEVFAISDEITVLRDGSVVAFGDVSEFNRESLIRAMVGRDIAHSQARMDDLRGEEILKVERLCGQGFQDCSFMLHQGEILGIGGLVGAGRTELLKAIAGFTEVESGVLSVDSERLTPSSPKAAAKIGIAMVPEDRRQDALLLERSIRENVVLPSFANLANRFGFLKRSTENDVSQTGTGRFSTKMVGVEQAVGELSGGNQQKVVLASRLATHPRILLLDEPTRGVDVGAKQEIHEHIRALAKEGVAILVVSSDLPELLSLSDRVLVMAGGQIQGELSGDAATEEGVMSLAVAR